MVGARPSFFDWAWLVVWIAISSAWCLGAATRLSATFDEPLYVARGLEGWRSGSHAPLLRLGTMPLPGDLHTLPLAVTERTRARPFDLTAELDEALPWSRAMTLPFWWLLLAYALRAGCALAGAWGGRVAVAWLACEPSLLAHAGLATTDIALAACLLAFAYHFRCGRDGAWAARIGWPTLWFAAAVLSKASAIVMAPLCMLVLELERRWTQPSGVRRSAGDMLAIGGGGLLLVFLYCGSDWRAEPSFVAWAHGRPPGAAAREATIWLADHLRIFSNAGEALVRQIRHNLRGHGAYLLGTVHPRALWCYFPVLLTIKLGEPLLLALPTAALLGWRSLCNWPLLLAAALTLYSLTFRVQLGVRMVLPIVVFAAIGAAVALVAAGAAQSAGWRRRVAASLIAAALLWNAANAAAVWPHGLAYVNRFWGGSENGYRLVSDSNYDWGQGVKELAAWQRAHGAAPLAVWYFGSDPLVERPPLRHLPLHAMPLRTPEEVRAALRGQRLAVGTTLLYGTGIDSDGYRQALAVLRQRTPIDRTTTFLIYDFVSD